MKRKSLIVLFVTLSTILPLSGCSSGTTKTTTVESGASDEGGRASYHREETTTVEKESSGECGGVLSCAVDVVGNIIAFPFRAVGALIGAIF